MGLRVLGFLKTNLTNKDQGEEGIKYLTFSISFVSRSPGLFSSRPTFSLVLLLLLIYPQKPFLLPFLCLSRFSSRTIFVLTQTLHHQTVSLCYFQDTWPCFHFFYASFLYLISVRSSLFTHVCLLPPLLDFLHMVIDCSGAWRKWTLKIKSSPGPLFSPDWSPSGFFQASPWTGKFCSPKDQGCDPAICLVLFSQASEPHHLLVTSVKAASDFNIPKDFIFVCNYVAQQTTLPHQLLKHLCEEVSTNAFQKPPGFLVPCSAVLPADIGFV